MKKILSFALCFAFMLGLSACSSSDNKGTDNKGQETSKESDHDIVSKVFTFETTDENGTKMGRLKDNGTIKFSVYLSFSDQDKQVAEAMGIKVGEIVYHANGDDSETYLVNNDQVFVTSKDTTAEAAKENMDAYLKEKNITIDQLKKAISEEFKI